MPEPTLAGRLGGRWAISLVGYSIGVSLTGLVLINLLRRDTGGLHLGASLLALAIAAAIAGILDLVLHTTLFAHRMTKPVPVVLVAMKHLLGGLALAGSMWWVSTVAMSDVETSPATMWVALSITGLWWGCTITVTLDMWSRSARTRAALVDEADQIEMATHHQAALARELAHLQATQVSETWRRLQADLDATSPGPESDGRSPDPNAARRLAESLRSASQGVIRETSSDIWSRSDLEMTRVRWRTVVSNVIRTQPLRPVPILTLGVLPRVVWELTDLGLARGGSMLVVSAALVGVECTLANRAMHRWPHLRALILVVTLAVMQSGILVASAFRNSWIPGYVTTDDVVSQMISGVLVVLMGSGWASFWTLSHRRDELFAERLDPARAAAMTRSAVLAEAARGLAQELHGGVQARLFACALALEMAVDANDAEALTRALATTRLALETPLDLTRTEDDLAGAVEEATRVWDGICEVTVHLRTTTGATVDTASVRRTIDEALVNAVRHGSARHVTVEVDRADDGWLRIVVVDDGSATVAEPRRGLGTSIFDLVTMGRWGRDSTESGTRLWLEIPPSKSPIAPSTSPRS